jgi:hypothetical protein
MNEERWRTDEDLAAARAAFVAQMPGFEQPVAYGVAGMDDGVLTFGHLNRPGGLHLLPAIVLALVCGHRAGTASYELTPAQFARAITLLSPAEAATHWDHPNLWSWRELVSDAAPDSTFVACFVHDMANDPGDAPSRAFLAALADDC